MGLVVVHLQSHILFILGGCVMKKLKTIEDHHSSGMQLQRRFLAEHMEMDMKHGLCPKFQPETPRKPFFPLAGGVQTFDCKGKCIGFL